MFIPVKSYDWNIISSMEDVRISYNAVDAYDSLHYVLTGYIDSVYPFGGNYTSFINVSSDAGKTWIKKYEIIADPMQGEKYPLIISDVKLLSENTIIAAGRDGLILRSTNFGDTWDSTFVECEKDATSKNLDFYDNLHGCLHYFYERYVFWITDDGGKSWQSIDKPELGIGLFTFADIVRLKDSVFVSLIMNYSNGDAWKIVIGFERSREQVAVCWEKPLEKFNFMLKTSHYF